VGSEIPNQLPQHFNQSWFRSLSFATRHRGASEGGVNRGRQFFLEKQWLKMEGFIKTVEDKWRKNKDRCPARAYSMDKWHGGVATLRDFLKGWGRNVRGEYRRRKEELMQQILKTNVEESEGVSLHGGQLCRRYQLEAEMEKLMEAEEIYWQQRGGKVDT
jgi:hypothetical protein